MASKSIETLIVNRNRHTIDAWKVFGMVCKKCNYQILTARASAMKVDLVCPRCGITLKRETIDDDTVFYRDLVNSQVHFARTALDRSKMDEEFLYKW